MVVPSVEPNGVSKFGWLNALKNSARNWIFHRSVTLKFFVTPMSTLMKLGALKTFRPRFPFEPGAGMQKY